MSESTQAKLDQTTTQELLDNLAELQPILTNDELQQRVLDIMTDLSGTAQSVLDSQSQTPSLITKLKSRKFWIAVLGAIAGLCGMITAGDNNVAIILFVVLEAIALGGYFFTEGTIDSTRTKELIQAATSIAEILGTVGPMLQPASIDADLMEVDDEDSEDLISEEDEAEEE